MAKPINTPIAGEIWHLSIEDLFAPVHETQRLGGDGPFVINLSVSTAPIVLPPKQFTSRWDVHVYQIQVTEDGRTRYRLRLGPFRTEDDADAILEDVREMYPGALTATAGAPDLRAIESLKAKLEAMKPKAAPPPKKPEKAAVEITFDLEQPLARAAAIVAKRLGETAKHKTRAAPVARVAPTAPTVPVMPPAASSAAASSPPVANTPPELSSAWALPLSTTRTTPKQATAIAQAAAVPTPAPVMTRAADPIPVPAIARAPDPIPAPVIARAPDPIPVPVIARAPEPAPVPVTARAPDPIPVPAPIPAAPVLTEVVAVTVARKMPATPRLAPKFLEAAAPQTLEPPVPVAPSKPAPAKARIPEVAAIEAVTPITLEPPMPAAPRKPAPATVRIPEDAAKISVTPSAPPVLTEAAAPITLEPPMPAAPGKPAPATLRIPEVSATVVATPATKPVAVEAATPITLEPPVSAAPDVAAPVLTLALEPAAAPNNPPPPVATRTPKPASNAPARAAKTPVPRPVASRWMSPRWAAPRQAVPRPLASRPAAPRPATPGPVAQTPAMQSSVAPTATAAVPNPMAPSPLAPPASAPSPPAASINSFRAKPAVPQLVAVAEVPAARPVKELSEPLLSLESTQTVRALTAPELEDEESLRWFVIQLATADNAFDPDTVPNLDIFGEYRLYSVACVDQGHNVHALRLGFFSEEIAAVAVASYLSAHYDKPTIRRISVAERERFAWQRVEARKDVGETGKHAAIEITDELVARRRRSTVAATKPEKSGKSAGHQSPSSR
jgi:hypothetical protein